MNEEFGKRALGLDALRGFAILMMFLSGLVPFYTNTLPSWMYHGQIPPPMHKFNPLLPGITWVDLVFPFFIFSMGAAIPLALNKRLENGIKLSTIILQTLERFLLLAGFAIYIQHVKPYALSGNPDIFTWGISLFGFILLFPVLYRFPKDFNANYAKVIRFGGILAIVLLLAYLKYPNKTGFLLTRSDIIILVLANVAFFGTLLWLITRKNVLLRLSIFGFLLAFRLGHNEIGWIKEIWNYSPFPWLYTLYYLQYLFVLIPGTIIGDMVINWMNEKEIQTGKKGISDFHLKLFAVSMIAINIFVLIGLKSRYVLSTLFFVVIWSIVNYYVIKKAINGYEKLFQKMYYWGVYFLIIGLFFEPFEGGIKKDHPTLSYYFVTVGLAIFTLIGLIIIIDILKQGKYLSVFTLNGQNPMIAYAGISNLIPPILGITGLADVLNMLVIDPWTGLLKGILITILLGVIVSYFTKYKIFLRT